MDLDPGSIMASIFVSAIGFVLFSYGRKQSRLPQMLTGAILMIYPYFVPSPLWMFVVAGVILALFTAAVKVFGL